MSNSTRPSGYDERLVVPLEASRRGAHRARMNPLVAALPLLAVVVVVAAVIGVAYTLFLKPSNSSNDSNTGGQALPAVSPAPPTTSSAAGATPSTTGASGSTSPSSSASASRTTVAVDKTTVFTVYNGSATRVRGLATRADDALKGAGWSAGQVQTSGLPVSPGQTTKVFYGKASQRATAQAIQNVLGVGLVRFNPTVAGQGVVVVVGDDYANH